MLSQGLEHSPDEAAMGEEVGVKATPRNGWARVENVHPLCFLPTHRHPWGPFWVFWWGHSLRCPSLEMGCHRGQNQPAAELQPILGVLRPDPDPTSHTVGCQEGLQGWGACSPAFSQYRSAWPYL